MIEGEDRLRRAPAPFRASTRALELLAEGGSALSRATLAYGVAMWHRIEGRVEEARALETLVAAEVSSAFGRLAAEVELLRRAALSARSQIDELHPRVKGSALA